MDWCRLKANDRAFATYLLGNIGTQKARQKWIISIPAQVTSIEMSGATSPLPAF